MTTNEYQIPHIPKTYRRYAMDPTERINSFADQAQAILENLDEQQRRAAAGVEGEEEHPVAIIALALAAAYVEGAQDGRSHGYADGFVSGKGGPTP
jgi:hypothetical protein